MKAASRLGQLARVEPRDPGAARTRWRPRPLALAFIPRGAKGAAVRTWIGEFGIEPVEVSGDAMDGLALRRMREGLRGGADVIIAVDGPSGPRRRVRPGALWLAAVAGVPIMPI